MVNRLCMCMTKRQVAKLLSGRRVTLPSRICKQLNISEGDFFLVELWKLGQKVPNCNSDVIILKPATIEEKNSNREE